MTLLGPVSTPEDRRLKGEFHGVKQTHSRGVGASQEEEVEEEIQIRK